MNQVVLQDVLEEIPWAARVAGGAVESLGRLRLVPGLEVAPVGDDWWVRGEKLSDSLLQQLKGIPGGEVYHVMTDRQLIPLDQQVPNGWLPEAVWSALREEIQPSLPSVGFAGQVAEHVPIRLVASGDERTANVLVLPFPELYTWGMNAPLVRLQRLRYAVNSAGMAIVQGSPLPSLRGKMFYEEHGIAVPLGMVWQPHLSAESLARTWRLDRGDICLWEEEQLQRISQEQFVACGRSSFRSTLDSLEGRE